MSRIFTTSVASAYPHHVANVERKGRTTAELDELIERLTGFDERELTAHLTARQACCRLDVASLAWRASRSLRARAHSRPASLREW